MNLQQIAKIFYDYIPSLYCNASIFVYFATSGYFTRTALRTFYCLMPYNKYCIITVALHKAGESNIT
jgi:hypothetical protein